MVIFLPLCCSFFSFLSLSFHNIKTGWILWTEEGREACAHASGLNWRPLTVIIDFVCVHVRGHLGSFALKTHAKDWRTVQKCRAADISISPHGDTGALRSADVYFYRDCISVCWEVSRLLRGQKEVILWHCGNYYFKYLQNQQGNW